jgi:phosphotransferase system HPr-like phosphotransfer protein
MIEKTVSISNELGLHARAAARPIPEVAPVMTIVLPW